MEEPFDLIVIGSGPGGYVAAIRAAQLGYKTACIEKSKTFGGVCLNVGCIPSKALLQSSEHVAFLKKNAKEHGIEIADISLNFKQMMKRKEAVVASLVKGVAGLLQGNHVHTFQGTARFCSPNKVEVVGDDGSKTLTGKHVILATGSEPATLPGFKFDEKRILSSTGALSLSAIPKKMLVIGAGVIGVELASVYHRLGSKVTLIEMLDTICPGMDRTVSKNLLQIFKKQGMTFHLGAKVLEAKVGKKQVDVSVEIDNNKQNFSSDVVLVAIGRRPYTKGLDLENAGVEMTNDGFVSVDHNFKTSQDHIYAIGDLIDGPMLAHSASEEGIATVEAIAGKTPHVNYAAIPNVIYTHPEVAALGLTEQEAEKMNLEIDVGTCFFRGNPRARCNGYTEGLVKVIGEKTSGRLIGMHIIGAHASEMIGEGVLALQKKTTLKEIAYASHAHPTLSESIKDAALSALGMSIHQ